MDDTTFLTDTITAPTIASGSGDLRWVTVAVVDPAILFNANNDD